MLCARKMVHMIAEKMFEYLPEECFEVDKRPEFLRDKEKVEFKLIEIFRASEIRQNRPSCYSLSES